MEPPKCEFHFPLLIVNPNDPNSLTLMRDFLLGRLLTRGLVYSFERGCQLPSGGDLGLPGTMASTIASRLKSAVNLSRATNGKPGGKSFPPQTAGQKKSFMICI